MTIKTILLKEPSPSFDLRFPGQDRKTQLAAAGNEISALVPVIETLRSQPTLSPDGLKTLKISEGRLQQQMNYFALAANSADDLRSSGLVPQKPEFEGFLRTAEAFRRGGDDLAGRTVSGPHKLWESGGDGQPLKVSEAASRLNKLSPDKFGSFLDSAISVASAPYLDTNGLLTSEQRDNALRHLGRGFGRHHIDTVNNTRDRIPWHDFGGTSPEATAAGNARLAASVIEGAAKSGLSPLDLAAVETGSRTAVGRQLYTEMVLPDMALGSLGGAIAGNAQRFANRELQEIVAHDGVEGLVRRLNETHVGRRSGPLDENAATKLAIDLLPPKDPARPGYRVLFDGDLETLDIWAHGTLDGKRITSGQVDAQGRYVVIDAKQLAKIIRSDPQFIDPKTGLRPVDPKTGQPKPVRLVACYAGKEPNRGICIGQALANELREPVIAADSGVHVMSAGPEKGEYYLQEHSDDLYETGKWILFNPR